MYKRIFRSVCLTAFAVFIASLALIMGMLYQYFDGRLKEEIRTEANYLAHAVNISGEEYLTELSPGDKRITLIGADGTVLYDSEADPDTMDNHSQRDEVIAARKYGLGESVRYSDTLTEKTVYCAVRLDSGDILRVSDVQASTFTVLQLCAAHFCGDHRCADPVGLCGVPGFCRDRAPAQPDGSGFPFAGAGGL